MNDLQSIFSEVLKIRLFEDNLLSLFKNGKISGTVHTCVGQEYTGVVLSKFKVSGDMVFSNHRGHGHYLSFTQDYQGLIDELLGMEEGCSKGFGGTQHLINSNFISNGIQGGLVPISAGFALQFEKNNQNQICYVFIGDGTLGEGVLWESLNIISKWEIPCLIILEDNGIAQSTSISQTLSGNLLQRIEGFGLKYYQTSTNNLNEFLETAEICVKSTRERRPCFLHIKTNRLNSHSKGDDNRADEFIQKLEHSDPLNRFSERHKEVYGELHSLHFDFIQKITKNSLSKEKNNSDSLNFLFDNHLYNTEESIRDIKVFNETKRYNEKIQDALATILKENSNSFLIGEDIEDGNIYHNKPYGGAFKVTRSLSNIFPGRVRNTPISEAAICGISIGVALAGGIGITEIMFGDFTTLIFDQLLQHASKIHLMYGKRINLPVIIRTPMGGYRGYGATHSQSIEKHFLGIPGLDVVVLNNFIDPLTIYETALKLNKPTLIVENKILYTQKLYSDLPIGYNLQIIETKSYPLLWIKAENSDVTIVSSGGQSLLIKEALEAVFKEDEILADLFMLTCISEFPINSILASVRKTKKLLVVEEGSSICSLAGEITIKLKEEDPQLDFKVCRLGNNTIIPSSTNLESKVLPSSKTIKELILKI